MSDKSAAQRYLDAPKVLHRADPWPSGKVQAADKRGGAEKICLQTHLWCRQGCSGKYCYYGAK